MPHLFAQTLSLPSLTLEHDHESSIAFKNGPSTISFKVCFLKLMLSGSPINFQIGASRGPQYQLYCCPAVQQQGKTCPSAVTNISDFYIALQLIGVLS